MKEIGIIALILLLIGGPKRENQEGQSLNFNTWVIGVKRDGDPPHRAHGMNKWTKRWDVKAWEEN